MSNSNYTSIQQLQFTNVDAAITQALMASGFGLESLTGDKYNATCLRLVQQIEANTVKNLYLAAAILVRDNYGYGPGR